MAIAKLHVKKGDKVVILSGKDKGRSGKIVAALPKTGKIIVEGINKVKRHTKPSQTTPQGGIIVKEAPMNSAKVMLVCPNCDQPTRIAKTQVANGKFARACKKCGEIVDKQ